MTDEILTLPDDLRADLKEPLGTIYTDVDELLAAAGIATTEAPLVAVGDVVTAHLLEAGHAPTVTLVDERTERSPVEDSVATTIDDARGGTFKTVVDVDNPAATLTVDLLNALVAAIERAPETTLIAVDGEEDLAALPAIIAIPAAGHVVYGQPGEGMVLVESDAARERARSILERMDGDVEAAFERLST